ncbi:MAG: HEPN domain-containing protein [Candidatus Scalindua sp.]|jgi:HEPN domain-containing protein|nr:HEPN domain-containing protein [Candidatus Scalindua sp.]
MKHITTEWLKSAKSDLDTINEILSNEQLTQIVAFHSQQCIEKTFKAVIEEFELSSIKTHDLITLKNTISSVYNESFDDDLLSLLNKLYIDSRYPGELGLLPDGKPGIDDVVTFYTIAKEIYEKAKCFLERE